MLERSGETATRSTPLDKYLCRDPDDHTSWYQFICKSGKVPVVHGNTEASWPLHNEYCRTTLLLHWPDWRKIADIVKEDETWTDKMITILDSAYCPNFVKAQIERAKSHQTANNNVDECDQPTSSPLPQPDWTDLIQPNAIYDDFTDDFNFWDGGPDYDWRKSSFFYDEDPEQWFCNNIINNESISSHDLDIPDVELSSLNEDQRFAFNLVLDALLPDGHQQDPLRLVVTGQAGSGKSFLIKCTVKAVRTLTGQNDAVQVLCPTGNSANLISGVTLHSFLHVPIGAKRSKDMTPPDGTSGETLQKKMPEP